MNKKYDLVLINTPNIRGDNVMRLGILTIASYVRKNRFNVSVVDGDIESVKEQIKQLDLNDTIVGFTAMTDVVLVAYDLCRFVKNLYPKAVCVIGGFHPNALPEETLLESDFDGVVYGEGELTMLDILKAHKKGKPLNGIPGTIIKSNTGIISGPPRALIENLDIIGQPAFDLVKIERLFGGIRNERVKYKKCINVMFARGCPFNCVFCSSRLMWTRRLRWHSLKYIMEQINFLIKTYDIDAMAFKDDELICDKAKITALCKTFIKTGIAEKLKWECQGRVDRVDKNILLMLKKAGCKLIRFGIESGSPKILSFLKRNTVTVVQALNAVRLCKENNLLSFGSFIIGSPEENLDDILQTINFIENSGLSCAGVFIATPYPGTDLYQICKENGYLADNINWNDFLMEGQTSKSLIRNKYFSAQQLNNICDYINLNIVYHLNQGRPIPKLDHRKEIEKILKGNLDSIKRGRMFKIKDYLHKAFENPKRIIPFIFKKIKKIQRKYIKI